MVLTDLLIQLQTSATASDLLLIFCGMLMVVGLVSLICYSLTRSFSERRQRDREGSLYQHRPSREAVEPSVSESEEEETPPPPSFPRSPERTDWKTLDTPSSPLGGACLACGAKVTEETSAFCPECGAERQRCPICQRYVAGGQALLACVHCRAPGHANEVLAWVEEHGTCPYCAHRIDRHDLTPPPVVIRGRRRKP